jgi:dihydrofolate reductase
MTRPSALSFAIVVACDEARGIGRDGGLPWKLPGEMAYFKRVTSEAAPEKQNAVVMGRTTFESIPPRFRPLKGRYNVVLSRDAAYDPEGAARASSLEAALALLDARSDIDKVFVIGGGQVYREALAHPACTEAYVTRVQGTFACDTFLPPFEQDFARVSSVPQHEGDTAYAFELYARKPA